MRETRVALVIVIILVAHAAWTSRQAVPYCTAPTSQEEEIEDAALWPVRVLLKKVLP